MNLQFVKVDGSVITAVGFIMGGVKMIYNNNGLFRMGVMYAAVIL